MYGIIYMTTNLVNGRKYIGQHKCKNANDSYLGSGTILKLAIEQYGRENFARQTLCICESKEELDQKEIEWIAKYNATTDPSFYNIQDGGNVCSLPGELNPMYGMCGELSPMYGWHPSEEERKKRSERMKGDNNPMRKHVFTDEERKAISDRMQGEKHWNYGNHMSEELKQIISQSHKGKPSWNKGLKMSDEARKKMSEAKKGTRPNVSEEEREKRRQRCIERNSSPEFKKQIDEARKRYHENGGRGGGKPVVCVETGVVYASGADASRAIGSDADAVTACLNGHRKTVKRLHWRRATAEEAAGELVYVP